jgi:cytochrome c
MKRVLLGACLIASSALLSTISHADGYQIAKNNDCFKCHEIDRGIKGPSFQYIGNAYRGRSDAAARLQNPIRNGITFYYFWEKMPANHKMSQAELDELTQWILKQ